MPDKNSSDDRPRKNLKFTYLLTAIMIIIVVGGYVYKVEIRSVIGLLSFLKQPVETTIPATDKPSETGSTSSMSDVSFGNSQDTKAAQKVSKPKKKKVGVRQKGKKPETENVANDLIHSEIELDQDVVNAPLEQGSAESILPAVEETNMIVAKPKEKTVQEYVSLYIPPTSRALVETQWLADNLKNPYLAIVYVGGPVSKKDNFEAKHIPGAVFLGFGKLMRALGDGSAPPDKANFEALAGSLGIGNDKHIVVLSIDTLFASTAFWLFDYFGHKNLSILNGTIAKWMNEGRPTESGPERIIPVTYKAAPNASLLATADDVLKNLKNPKTVILDVRSAGEYNGTEDPTNQNKKLGRIPGAVNFDFFSANLNNDGTFKSVNAMKAGYEAKGVTKDKEIIVYCQGGVRAAVSAVALRHILGYPDVRNYVGSWDEWGNRLDSAKYPIER